MSYVLIDNISKEIIATNLEEAKDFIINLIEDIMNEMIDEEFNQENMQHIYDCQEIENDEDFSDFLETLNHSYFLPYSYEPLNQINE